MLITIVKSNIVQARVPKCECWDLSVKTQQCFKNKILKVKMLDEGFNLNQVRLVINRYTNFVKRLGA